MTEQMADWLPEIVSVLVFGTVYTGIMYRWLYGELTTMGVFFLWLSFATALVVLFGVDRIREAISIMDS